MKVYTFNQLSKKAKKYAIECYRVDSESPNAPVEEVEEYYNMANGYGGALLFNNKGEVLEVDEYYELYI